MTSTNQPRRVTLTALAKQLSLSICTVSRILNDTTGTTNYPQATVRRVRQAAARAGYQPNAVARSLVTGRTGTVGLCLADIGNLHFADFAAVFERRAAAKGTQTFICNTAEDSAQELQVIQSLLSRQVDSLVLSPTSDARLIPELKKAAASGCRVVLFDRQIEGLDAPCVLTDNYAAMRTLCERCLAKGHRSVGVIAGDDRDPTLHERLQAVRDAVAAAGLPADAVRVSKTARSGPTSVASGEQQMQELLTLLPGLSLFLSVTNSLSIGALRAARSAGLKVGVDFSFAAFDDFPGSDLLDPAITLVAQPVGAMAEACAELAISQTPPSPKPVVIASTIRWRESVT